MTKLCNATTLRFGSMTDRRLRAEGALAQTLDGATILLHSTLLTLPDWSRMLIVAHELAHIDQVRRGGNDPVRALEEEAWEAAFHWLSGRQFAVRGRGRGPLNALALINDGVHPHAAEWYGLGQNEPIGNNASIKVDRVEVIRNMTLESLLDRLIQSRPREVLVVAHGTTDGQAMPATIGAPAGADVNTLGPLATDRETEGEDPMGRKTRMPPISDERVVQITSLTDAAQVRRLRSKMNQVRALKINHLALRSCDTGKSKDTLRIYKDFFGVASVSAPYDYDSYGKFNPGPANPGVESWAQETIRRGYRIVIEGGVAFGTKKTQERVFLIAARAESREAVRAWVKRHIRDGYDSGDIVYHAVVIDPDHPTKPSVNFVRDADFIGRMVYVAG